MMIHTLVIPITDLALVFNIKQTKSFIIALQNLTQYIWFIYFFSSTLCRLLFKTYGNSGQLMYAIDSPLCWVRLLWSAAICIWKWSGLEWAWGEVQLGMMGKESLPR